MLRQNTPMSMDVRALRATIDPIDNYREKIYAAAVWYAKNGFHIVPFRMGDKEGRYKGFPKIDPRDQSEKPDRLDPSHATCNLKTIDKWWHPLTGQYPALGIAMAHGGASGLCAIDLDVDPDKNIDGIATLADAHSAYGSYDDVDEGGLDTLMATTPSGGRHLVFRFHPEIGTDAGAVFEGIDTRGGNKHSPAENGGITFIEPTEKADRDGSYRWDDDTTDITDPPQWLIDLLNGRKPARGKVRLPSHFPEGSRDSDIYRALMSFVGAGYTERQLWDMQDDILDRMDPPDPAMVQKNIRSAIASDIFERAQEEVEIADQVAGIKLQRNDKNRIIRSAINLEAILKSSLFEHGFGCVRFDDFTQQITRNGVSMASRSDWAVGVQLWIAKKIGVEWPPGPIRDMLEHLAADEFEHINTARDYMVSCPAPAESGEMNFNGSGRKGPGPAFRRLCYDVLDLGNPRLHPGYDEGTRHAYEGFMWVWLQGVAARACVPGCKMDMVLNIFGKQGIRKSSFFRRLCPQESWFTDQITEAVVGGMNTKDELAKLHAKIIVEMAELSPVKKGGKSTDDRLKQFISAQSDRMRAPYGKDTLDYPRTCAFAGTSNNRDVYRDATGSRRFISIDHGDKPIRTAAIDEFRDELWGEVMDSFAYGELHKSNAHRLEVAVPESLWGAQDVVNSGHKYESLGADELLEWAEDKTRFTWTEIREHVLGSVYGVRDEKESTTMRTLKPVLENAGFTYSKVQAHSKDGVKRRQKLWINTNHELEKDRKQNDLAPPHWSAYAGDKEEY